MNTSSLSPKPEPERLFKDMSRRHKGRRSLCYCRLDRTGRASVETAWPYLGEGVPVFLVREKNDPKDRYAVSVHYIPTPEEAYRDGGVRSVFLTAGPTLATMEGQSLLLGYLPGNKNREIATVMDAGYTTILEAEIVELDWYAPYHEIHICVYLRLDVSAPDRDSDMRGIMLSKAQYEQLVEALETDGTALFNWAGNKDIEYVNLPADKEQILLVVKDGDDLILHRLTTGPLESDEPEDGEEGKMLHRVGNAAGPYRVAATEELVWMVDNELSAMPYGTITPRLADALDGLIDKQINKRRQ